nr:MAG TPA: hypothetical protein [Caudoviricetes sp.]
MSKILSIFLSKSNGLLLFAKICLVLILYSSNCPLPQSLIIQPVSSYWTTALIFFVLGIYFTSCYDYITSICTCQA